MTCAVADCGREAMRIGLCHAHRHRRERWGDAYGRNVLFGASMRARLDRGLPEHRDPDDCWTWQRATNKGGYGVISTMDGRTRGAHRAAYEEFVGPIPSGLHLDHLCRNKACCNPAHLEPVAQSENNRRAWSYRKAAR